MKFWKQVTFALLGSALALCNSCQSSSANSHTEQKQILRVNIFSEPPTMDPRMVSDLTSAIVLQQLFEGLMRRDAQGLPQLAIAQSVDVSQDGLTYTFTLRPTKWNDGSALTSKDFAYAWSSMLDPQFPSTYAYQLYLIENGQAVKEGRLDKNQLGISTPDEQTLVVKLENPAPYFTQMLCMPTYFPVKEGIDQISANWSNNAGPNYFCNGPFKLDTWSHNNQINAIANPNYWDAASVKLNQIHMVMVSDGSTELSMFQSGQLDWAGMPFDPLPSDALPTLQHKGELQIFPMSASYWYFFNTKAAPFSNVNMRRAFSIAINRQALVDSVAKYQGTVSTALLPLPLAVSNTSYFTDGDVTTAQKYFNQGLADMKLTKEQLPPIVLSYNSNELNQKVAQAVQQQWQQAFGIAVALENQDWKLFLQNLQQFQFQIARLGWVADYNDPLSFLQIFQYAGNLGSDNFTQWHNDQYSSLLAQASATQGISQRNALLAQAEQVFMDQMPLAPVFALQGAYVKNPMLTGFDLSSLSIIDFKTAQFQIPGASGTPAAR